MFFLRVKQNLDANEDTIIKGGWLYVQYFEAI
jgi:hypothetical protein